MSTRITRILVPTDFSERSSVALEYGQALAERLGASLHVLHVVEDPFILGSTSSEIYVPDVPALRAALVTEAEAQLASLLSGRVRDAIRVTSEVKAGRAAAVIGEVAETALCDLIVMGTHGRSGVAHLLLGSVAEKVVRTAPCPVVTIRDDAHAREHVLESPSQTSAKASAVA